MQKQNFLAMIQRRKAVAPKRKVVPPKWLYPTTQEREYHRDLKVLTKFVRDQIIEILYPEIPSMIDEVQAKTPSNDRADDYLDRLKHLLLFIRKKTEPLIEITVFKMKLI